MARRMASPPGPELAARYERAAVNASRLESHAESDLMWERLIQLKPNDSKYRFALATSLVERGELTQAALHLDILTGKQSYAPAHLWLVQQSRQEDASFPLSVEQQITHLQAVIEQEPHNTSAHRLLAQTYIERKDFRLAEQHLLRAVELHPQLGLLLYELQVQLKRTDQAAGMRYLRNAARSFEETVIQTPTNAQSRIFWSQALTYLGKTAEAEAVLTEALTVYDSPELRHATAEFMIRRVRVLIAQSPLNAQTGAGYLVRASQIQPDHPLLAPLCVALTELGAQFSEDDLAGVVAHLRTIVEADRTDNQTRLTLARLLVATDNHSDAEELLTTHQEGDPQVQSLLVNVYRATHRHDAADDLAESMLIALQQNADTHPDQVGAITDLVQGLVIARRNTDAVEVVDALSARIDQPLYNLPPQLKQLYVNACIASFQSLDATDHESAFSFVQKAIETRQINGNLIQTIANLAYGDSPNADRSRQILTGVLASGTVSSRVYTSLGTMALAAGKTQDAVEHLQLAIALAPENPAIQNNLALALIRQSDDNAGVAFDLCNQALKTIPGHPDALSTRAEIQMARHRWAEARIDLEAALPGRPQSASLRRLLVEVCTELNKSDLAAEHQRILDQIEQSEPGSSAPATEDSEAETDR